MYTKTTAACGSRCNGKAHYLKTSGPSLSFPFPRWTSKSSLKLHPLVCSGLLTPDISIKSGDIAPKRRVWTDADGMSANLCLNSDHSWQHHSFFKSLAINVAWNCNVISPNGTSVWKSATVKVDTDILSGNDWQASWHIVASAFQHNRSAEGIFSSPRHRLHPRWNTVSMSGDDDITCAGVFSVKRNSDCATSDRLKWQWQDPRPGGSRVKALSRSLNV